MKLRKMRFIGEETHIIMMKNTYKILVRKPEGKKLFDRRRCRWENNVKMHVTEIWFVCVKLYLISSVFDAVTCYNTIRASLQVA